MNQNMMFMNNMKNQSNSKNINIEEIIKPFKEKIRKLQDEISEKDSEIAQLKFKLMQYDNDNKSNDQFINNNMGQMNINMGQMNNNMGQINNSMGQMNNNIGQMNNNIGQMNNNMGKINNNMGQMNNNMGQINNSMGQMNNNMGQMNPMNNNGNQICMNMINNPFNMMNNQFNMNNMMNNFQMNNQMNQMNNMINQINIMENEKLPRLGMGHENLNIKNLRIKIKMEKDRVIQVLCRSNDKMKNVLKNFYTKACINEAEAYDFIIIKEEKVKLDSSIEQNGIKQKDYILAKKRLVNEKENQEDQSLNDKKEPNFIKENPRILGEQIDLYFISSSGLKVLIPIGLNNTIKDAYILYCNKVDINYSEIGKNIMFLYNGFALSYEDNKTLKQIGFRNINNNKITVYDNYNVIGA